MIARRKWRVPQLLSVDKYVGFILPLGGVSLSDIALLAVCFLWLC
jgi:hypothetical protein